MHAQDAAQEETFCLSPCFSRLSDNLIAFYSSSKGISRITSPTIWKHIPFRASVTEVFSLFLSRALKTSDRWTLAEIKGRGDWRVLEAHWDIFKTQWSATLSTSSDFDGLNTLNIVSGSSSRYGSQQTEPEKGVMLESSELLFAFSPAIFCSLLKELRYWACS